MIETTCLGKLHRLRIRHDNSGFAPGWFLENIVVNDTTQKCVYDFPCNSWVDENKLSYELEYSVVILVTPPPPPPGKQNKEIMFRTEVELYGS